MRSSSCRPLLDPVSRSTSMLIGDTLHQADDELDLPILAGFEWDKEESWTRLVVHQKKEGAPVGKGKKSKKIEE